jgi:predicted ribosome quality control (RQC) complex YloA/Tae2 family protein
MDAVENANRYYKKAQKGKRGLEAAQSKVAASTSELKELEGALQNLEQSLRQAEVAPQTLEQLQAMVQPSAPKRQSAATAENSAEHEGLPYRVLHYEGWEILVGRNSTQNDELSTRFAKPWDIWMHVAAHAGSHVVIRRPKNGPWPPHNVVEAAASFAVWFSKAKHTSFAEVHVTERRFVTKRRKSPPGEVQIQQYKTVRVAPLSPQQFFKN